MDERKTTVRLGRTGEKHEATITMRNFVITINRKGAQRDFPIVLTVIPKDALALAAAIC